MGERADEGGGDGTAPVEGSEPKREVGAGAVGEVAAPEAAVEALGDGAVEEGGGRRRGVFGWLGRGFRLSRTAVVLVVVPGVVLVVFGLWWMEQDTTYVASSRISMGSDVVSNPNEATSPEYQSALEQGEADRRREAVQAGESFVPAMQSQSAGVEAMVMEPVVGAAKPPSQRVRDRVDAVVAEQLEAAQAEKDPFVDRTYQAPKQVGTALVREAVPVEGLQVMFDGLFEVWDAPASGMRVQRYDVEVAQAPAPAGVQGAAPGQDAGGDVAPPAAPGPVLVGAGKMLYATTKVGVDSELGLPVLVEVLERPFSGALLRGEFQQVRDRMMVRFHRLSDPRRDLDVEVNAYAVGLDCECGAVDGEVDRHWFSRVVLPAAVGFAEEYLAAASRPDVTISVDGQVISERSQDENEKRIAAGLSGAVQRTGDVVLEGLPKRATVRLPRGTEIAVVFVDAVRGGEGEQG